MQRVAQDWLVLQLSANSGTAIGITTGLQFLPFLLFGPLAGLVADRMPKRTLLQLTNLGMAIPAAILGALAVTGTAESWHVYVLAFALGTASAFDAPARQSFVSELVDPGDLTNAVGLNSASFNAARIVGPAVAGLLIAAFGGGAAATGWVILLNAATYAAPIWALGTLDTRLLDTPEPPPRGKGLIREGFAYIASRPDLVLVLLIVFVVGTFGLNFQMTSALMATEVFQVGPTAYGLLGTFMAFGSLAGAHNSAARPSRTQHQVLEDQDAGPQGFAAASRCVHSRVHQHPEEAQLGAAQGGPCAAHLRCRSHRLHPGRGPQPAGAQHRARAWRPCARPSRCALQDHPRRARRCRREEPQASPQPLRRQDGQVSQETSRTKNHAP
jgi:MFS family permease